MGAKTRRIRMRKKYHFSANRNKKTNDRRKRNRIECISTVLKDDWDPLKRAEENFKEMGLAIDPNKILGIPSAKDLSMPKKNTVESTSNWSVDESHPEDIIVPSAIEKEKLPKAHVQEKFEELAGKQRKGVPRIPKPEQEFVYYMVNKHGSDYEAMAADPKNIYQDTSNTIRRKVEKVLAIPEFAVKCLKAKGAIPQRYVTKHVSEKVYNRWQRWENTKQYILNELQEAEAEIGKKDRLRRERLKKEKAQRRKMKAL